VIRGSNFNRPAVSLRDVAFGPAHTISVAFNGDVLATVSGGRVSTGQNGSTVAERVELDAFPNSPCHMLITRSKVEVPTPAITGM
jgi:hypothetical protein